MVNGLSPEAVSQYRRDGFYFPVRVLSADRAATLRARFEAFEASAEAAAYPDRHDDLYLFKPHLLFTWADEIVHDPAVVDVAEAIVGPDVVCWSAGLFKKDARSTDFVSWHQDATHYGLDDHDHVVRIWVALTPTCRANGTMLFAPDSHRHGTLPHRDTVQPDGLLSRGESIDLAIDEAAAVPVELEPGECSLHHLTMAHCSGPNETAEPRINLVITYIAAHVRPAVVVDTAMHVRGRDRGHHYRPEPRPSGDMDASARAAHAEAMAIRNRNFFGHADRREALVALGLTEA